MNKLMKFIALNMMAIMLPFSAGIAAEASNVATAQDNIVVNTTGQVTLSLTPVTTILASNYQSGTILATYSASATAGSVAIRLNPTIMKASSSLYGTATSTSNATNTIAITTSATCNGSEISGWFVCSQGVSANNGRILTSKNQSIPVGTYPLSLDAAIWQF
ncbi:hypothetical protein ACRZTK_004416 [Enterobacter asburiae]